MCDVISADLMQVTQLPVIEQQLILVKDAVERKLADVSVMVCTEETLKAAKASRARVNQLFDEFEARRKEIKKAVMKPYEDLEAVYKECITTPFRRAKAELDGKIIEVETGIKLRCEDRLRDYFAELCAVRHLDWLTYEQAGIKIDMASARAETPKRLMEQLAAFVDGVAESVERITTLEDAGEIMVEYQRSLDAADAICTVRERRRLVEEQEAAQEARKAVLEREAEMVRRVEALAPPVAVSAAEEKTIRVQLILHPTKSQFEEKIKPIMKQLKEICDMEGIRYE